MADKNLCFFCCEFLLSTRRVFWVRKNEGKYMVHTWILLVYGNWGWNNLDLFFWWIFFTDSTLGFITMKKHHLRNLLGWMEKSGGFKYFWCFSPTCGNGPIWPHNMFQMGWKHQLVLGGWMNMVSQALNWGHPKRWLSDGICPEMPLIQVQEL